MALTTLTINRNALAQNINVLRGFGARNSKLAAVVKADCYGLGLGALVQTFWDQGIRRYYVAFFEEAAALKKQFPQAEVIVFAGLVGFSVKDFKALGIIPVLNTFSQLETWLHSGAQRLVLHVDTGMRRLGLESNEQEKLEPSLFNGRHLTLMSHFACADNPQHPLNNQQLARFNALAAKLKPQVRSMANSAALVTQNPAASFEELRPGLALYGASPLAPYDCHTNAMRISCVAALESQIIQIRNIQPGESIGYGAGYIADKAMRVATVPVGYADGWLRAAQSAERFVRVEGKEVALIGRISMDSLILDVTTLPDICVGQKVDLFSRFGDVEKLSKASNSIPNDWLTAFGSRYKRVYID